jgi:hypothetical protein
MTTTAVAFPFTLRGGRKTTIDQVPDDTWGFTTARITSHKAFGRGDSLRVRLGVTASDGTAAVATIDAEQLRQIPDFLRRPGTRVKIYGVVHHHPDAPTNIEVINLVLA